MATHWTYATFKDNDDLEQGDFHVPTPELTRVLSEVHGHFAQEKYLGFMTVTNTCDMVRRPTPKSPYVAIAAVRSFEQSIPKLASAIGAPVAPGTYTEDKKEPLRQLLKRVLDQNEQALGLFYLHEDAELGLGESALAFLRVVVALRVEHYDVLCRARRGRLLPAFQSKLGWLVGNLYGRPATPDWADITGGKRAFDEIVRKVIDEGPLDWAHPKAIASARKAGLDLSALDREARRARLDELRPGKAKDAGISRILEITKTHLKLTDDQVEKLRIRLTNDPTLTQSFRG